MAESGEFWHNGGVPEDNPGKETAMIRTVRFLRVLSVCLPVLAACHTLAHARTIEFAGREWTVRSGEGGPGPNKWSDSAESVWVDGAGLHLRVRNIEGVWHCAEVTSVLPARHGMHRFYVTGRVDLLDRNIVASPFLYQDDSHEVDIEFSRWRRRSGSNTQYVVQPHAVPGNIRRFEMALDGELSTHCINWLPGSIEFRSFSGHSETPAAPNMLIQEWVYAGGDNPPEGDGMRIHINLWLVGGLAPSDGKEAEFVIKDADLPAPPESPAGEKGAKGAD